MCAIAQQTSQYVDISQTHINSLSLKYFELTSSSGGEACHMSASVYTGGGWRAHLCFSDPDAPSDISGDRYNGQILCSPPRT